MDHLYSCRFGTFLYNCESARDQHVRLDFADFAHISETQADEKSVCVFAGGEEEDGVAVVPG